jgi:hypothetical protein
MEKVVKSNTEISHKGDTWVGEWASYILTNGQETPDHWLVISKKESGVLANIENNPDVDEDEIRLITKLVRAERVREIQGEYGIPSDETEMLAITEKILERSWAGEWMGQAGYGFFIDDLAGILNLEFIEAAQIVRTLNLQGKAGLNGFIIVPWEEQEAAYQSWDDATGHKRLLVSDFGGWHCNHCGNQGDEYGPSAKEVPCVPNGNQEGNE